MNKNWIFVYIVSFVATDLAIFLLIVYVVLGSSILDVRSINEFMKYILPSFIIPAIVIFFMMASQLKPKYLALFVILFFIAQSLWVVVEVSQIKDPISRAYGLVRLWQPLAGAIAAVIGYFASRNLYWG